MVLLFGDNEKALLRSLREKAEATPIDVEDLTYQMSNEETLDAYSAKMRTLTISLPANYQVTFSVEEGHPEVPYLVRHMSVSVGDGTKLPCPETTSLIANELGFDGGISKANDIWVEHLENGGNAINVVQVVTDQLARLSHTIH